MARGDQTHGAEQEGGGDGRCPFVLVIELVKMWQMGMPENVGFEVRFKHEAGLLGDEVSCINVGRQGGIDATEEIVDERWLLGGIADHDGEGPP